MLYRMIVATDVGMTDAGKILLHPVSFRADPGTLFCVHGPAGCGKSILAALLAGGMEASSGRITVDGVEITRMRPAMLQTYRQHLGIVTQRPLLQRHGSIRDNILLAAALRNNDAEFSTDALLRSLRIHNLSEMSARFTSANVQMLTTIARALVGKPAILLLDEPFSRLERAECDAVRTVLSNAVRAGATAFVFVRNPADLGGLPAELIALGAPAAIPAAEPTRIAQPKYVSVRIEEESPQTLIADKLHA